MSPNHYKTIGISLKMTHNWTGSGPNTPSLPTTKENPSRISYYILTIQNQHLYVLLSNPVNNGFRYHVLHVDCSAMYPHSCAKCTECTKQGAHTQKINFNFIPQKDTMIPYGSYRHSLKNQVLAIFPPSSIITETLHYSEFQKWLAFSTSWSNRMKTLLKKK